MLPRALFFTEPGPPGWTRRTPAGFSLGSCGTSAGRQLTFGMGRLPPLDPIIHWGVHGSGRSRAENFPRWARESWASQQAGRCGTPRTVHTPKDDYSSLRRLRGRGMLPDVPAKMRAHFGAFRTGPLRAAKRLWGGQCPPSTIKPAGPIQDNATCFRMKPYSISQSTMPAPCACRRKCAGRAWRRSCPRG